MIDKIEEEEFVSGTEYNKLADAVNEMAEEIEALKKGVGALEGAVVPDDEKAAVLDDEKDNNGERRGLKKS